MFIPELSEMFENPSLELLGDFAELTGSGGSDNDDGWGCDSCAR